MPPPCNAKLTTMRTAAFLTRSSSPQNISYLSFRIDGTTGLVSLITPFAAFILDEIRFLGSCVGCDSGCQQLSLAGEKLSNSALLCALLQEINRPRNAELTGSPRIFWLALMPDWPVNEKIARPNRSENIGGTCFVSCGFLIHCYQTSLLTTLMPDNTRTVFES